MNTTGMTSGASNRGHGEEPKAVAPPEVLMLHNDLEHARERLSMATGRIFDALDRFGAPHIPSTPQNAVCGSDEGPTAIGRLRIIAREFESIADRLEDGASRFERMV